MRKAAAALVVCDCAVPEHELRCANALVVQERGRLYEGLYDGRGGRLRPKPALHHVQLLNPSYDDEDPAGRRFALLEID